MIYNNNKQLFVQKIYTYIALLQHVNHQGTRPCVSSRTVRSNYQELFLGRVHMCLDVLCAYFTALDLCKGFLTSATRFK